MASCPECAAAIEIEEDEVEEGQILECPECDARLEVVNTHPLELDLIPEENEDEEEAEV
jgi:alpha-aminoadipate carrier protein LysW